MKKLYEKYKGKEIIHEGYSGIICGYSDVMFYLCAVTKHNLFYRKLPKDVFISEEYKEAKYKYIGESESEIEKQLNAVL